MSLVHYAKENAVDLAVLGARGMGSFQRWVPQRQPVCCGWHSCCVRVHIAWCLNKFAAGACRRPLRLQMAHMAGIHPAHAALTILEVQGDDDVCGAGQRERLLRVAPGVRCGGREALTAPAERRPTWWRRRWWWGGSQAADALLREEHFEFQRAFACAAD
jgi:hypothetical protein